MYNTNIDKYDSIPILPPNQFNGYSFLEFRKILLFIVTKNTLVLINIHRVVCIYLKLNNQLYVKQYSWLIFNNINKGDI